MGKAHRRGGDKARNLADTVHFYHVISEKYDYLKPNGTISIEYDVDRECYIVGVSLDKFLKKTIEIQPLGQESWHSLKNIKRFKNSKNSQSTNSFESFKAFTLFIDLLIY